MKPKSLEEKLDIDINEERENVELEPVEVNSQGAGNDLPSDYDVIRRAIITAIVRAEEVLTESVRTIKLSGGSPRDIEASASILKTLSDNSKNLLDMHKQINEMIASEEGKGEGENKEQHKATLADVVRLVKSE